MSSDSAHIIYGLLASAAKWFEAVNVALELSYMIVFFYDINQNNPYLKSSFFILFTFNIFAAFSYKTFEFVFHWFPSFSAWKLYPYIWCYYAIMTIYDGMLAPIIAYNRYTAIVTPMKHSKIWTIKRTIYISLASLIIPIGVGGSMSYFKHRGLDYYSGIFLGAGALIILIAAFIGTLITIFAVILSRKQFSNVTVGNNLRMKAEKKLLYLASYMAILHFYRNADYIYMAWILHYEDDGIVGEIRGLIMLIAEFGLNGGLIILYFSISSDVKKSFYRLPPIHLSIKLFNKIVPEKTTVSQIPSLRINN